jgi:hypothetical protein
MKLKIISAALLFALAATATAEDAGKTLAATLDIYAFPKAGEQAQQQAAAQADQAITASAEEIANFKKAFSTCMEAKDYLVKY